jgi:FKBP-type peptidyl-prolyl cis-trans isomerase
MKSLAVAVAVLALAAAGGANAAEGTPPAASAAKPAPAPAKPAAKPDMDATLYGIGLVIARNLDAFSLSRAELDRVIVGLRDGVTGKPKVELDQPLQMSINELARTRLGAKEKKAGGPYLAKMALDPKAKKTASGAIVIPLQEGTGASPTASDTVEVHYTGTLVDGSVFDSSRGRGPAKFPLGNVIPCWTEAMQQMKVGGKAKIVCPAEIAYGDRGSPPRVPPNAVLTFEVELLNVVK